MASHVGLFPLKLSVDGKVITTGGIGGVATDPDFQGKGFMTELLKYTIAEMEKRKYPISVLWGDRFRYGNFGWEWTGTRLVTGLNKRDMEKRQLKQKVKLKKYTGNRIDLQRIMKIHNSEPLYVKRNERAYRALLGRDKQETWLGSDKNGLAYIVLTEDGKDRTVFERGGEPGTFLKLASQIFEKTGASGLRIVQPNRLTPLTNMLLKTCGRWSWELHTMLKIVDLNSTFKAFGVRSGGIQFKMTDTNEKRFGPLRIASGREITLPRMAMVRLLFGPMPPSRYFEMKSDLAKILDSMFPLDFYVWPMDHV